MNGKEAVTVAGPAGAGRSEIIPSHNPRDDTLSPGWMPMTSSEAGQRIGIAPGGVSIDSGTKPVAVPDPNSGPRATVLKRPSSPGHFLPGSSAAVTSTDIDAGVPQPRM